MRNSRVRHDDIQAISENHLDEFDERLEAILQYVRSVANGTVDDDGYDAVSAHVDDATVVGITQLAIHCIAAARFVDALQFPPEEEFIGWTVDNG